MKNTVKVLVLFLVVALAFGLAGCKREKKPTRAAAEPYSIDISTLASIPGNVGAIGPNGGWINVDPLLDQWADFPVYLPPFPENIQWFSPGNLATYDRVRIRATYYWDDMEEHDPGNSMVMLTLIYDPEGDWRGPPEEPGPNTPLKAFNVTRGPDPGQEEDDMPYGSRVGGVSSPGGTMCVLRQAPSILLFQNANVMVEYIELLEITFFQSDN